MQEVQKELWRREYLGKKKTARESFLLRSPMQSSGRCRAALAKGNCCAAIFFCSNSNRGGMMLVFCGFFWLLILRVCFPVLQDFLRLLGVPLQAGKHDIGVIGAIVEFIH